MDMSPTAPGPRQRPRAQDGHARPRRRGCLCSAHRTVRPCWPTSRSGQHHQTSSTSRPRRSTSGVVTTPRRRPLLVVEPYPVLETARRMAALAAERPHPRGRCRSQQAALPRGCLRHRRVLRAPRPHLEGELPWSTEVPTPTRPRSPSSTSTPAAPRGRRRNLPTSCSIRRIAGFFVRLPVAERTKTAAAGAFGPLTTSGVLPGPKAPPPGQAAAVSPLTRSGRRQPHQAARHAGADRHTGHQEHPARDAIVVRRHCFCGRRPAVELDGGAVDVLGVGVGTAVPAVLPGEVHGRVAGRHPHVDVGADGARVDADGPFDRASVTGCWARTCGPDPRTSVEDVLHAGPAPRPRLYRSRTRRCDAAVGATAIPGSSWSRRSGRIVTITFSVHVRPPSKDP